jgi:hypothetical protein
LAMGVSDGPPVFHVIPSKCFLLAPPAFTLASPSPDWAVRG